jgi:hypothetical protein
MNLRTSNLRLPAFFLLLLFAAAGANCQQMVTRYSQPLPRVLPPAATLAQVVEVVNRNSSSVTSLSTSRATVSVPGYPVLRTNLAFQRPRDFRLRADLALSGPEVDLGSNDTIFWFWVRHENPPSMYYCRHDQFATSAARQVLPVEPDWLAQAFGLVSFETGETHDGPYPLRGGKLEIRSTVPGPDGPRRVTIIDESSGVVLEQHIYDARGTLLASAIQTGHQRDPATNVVLPRRVRILWPTAHFEMTVDLADLQINRLTADPAALFTKPDYPGYVNVDLAAPNPMSANVGTPIPLPAPPISTIPR